MNITVYADLHNHTTASDGDYTPEGLVDAAKEKGIKALGVTDHDTIDGVEAALKHGDAVAVTVVPGVEISVRFKEPLFTGTLHLLTYFDRSLLIDKGFRSDLSETLGKGRGDGLVRARVNEINKIFGPEGATPILGSAMEFDKVAAYSPAVTRRHFALALNEIHGIEDADTVNRIIGNDSPAYLPSGVDLGSVGEFIQKYPVVAVLAHPAAGSYPGEGHYKEVLPPLEIVEKILPRFLHIGLQGIEINYPGHIEAHRNILRGWKEKYHLVETGGSDCHDATVRPMGIEGISKEAFERFQKRLHDKSGKVVFPPEGS